MAKCPISQKRQQRWNQILYTNLVPIMKQYESLYSWSSPKFRQWQPLAIAKVMGSRLWLLLLRCPWRPDSSKQKLQNCAVLILPHHLFLFEMMPVHWGKNSNGTLASFRQQTILHPHASVHAYSCRLSSSSTNSWFSFSGFVIVLNRSTYFCVFR